MEPCGPKEGKDLSYDDPCLNPTYRPFEKVNQICSNSYVTTPEDDIRRQHLFQNPPRDEGALPSFGWFVLDSSSVEDPQEGPVEDTGPRDLHKLTCRDSRVLKTHT